MFPGPPCRQIRPANGPRGVAAGAARPVGMTCREDNISAIHEPTPPVIQGAVRSAILLAVLQTTSASCSRCGAAGGVCREPSRFPAQAGRAVDLFDLSRWPESSLSVIGHRSSPSNFTTVSIVPSPGVAA